MLFTNISENQVKIVNKSKFKIIEDKEALRLEGTLDLYQIHEAKQTIEKALNDYDTKIIDLSGLNKLDTVGALLLLQLQDKHKLKIENLKAEYSQLFKLVEKSEIAPPKLSRRKPEWKKALIGLGKQIYELYWGMIEFTEFLGQTSIASLKVISNRKYLRLPDITHYIKETGIDAVPIISVMAFMIAVVLAYQGIAQLRPLGAENLTVNMVAISVLREMGVLLTSIMIAGRSGSAFTAQIGVMKVREEVDALQVIGIDPFAVLVMPRVIALIVTLPLLTFIADIMGLLGGAVTSMTLIDIPIGTYIDRVRMVAHVKDFAVGMIKAPIFALIIALVGCMHGLKVSGSAESVGKETTASVVKAIFLVLVTDALFSIFFEKVGL